MNVVYAEAVVVTVKGHFHFVVTVDVTYVFVTVFEDRETKIDCSVLVTVTDDGEANGQGMTVDTKS